MHDKIKNDSIFAGKTKEKSQNGKRIYAAGNMGFLLRPPSPSDYVPLAILFVMSVIFGALYLGRRAAGSGLWK
jgi:hypothetical protein